MVDFHFIFKGLSYDAQYYRESVGVGDIFYVRVPDPSLDHIAGPHHLFLRPFGINAPWQYQITNPPQTEEHFELKHAIRAGIMQSE
jgi:hypothetical protein